MHPGFGFRLGEQIRQMKIIGGGLRALDLSVIIIIALYINNNYTGWRAKKLEPGVGELPPHPLQCMLWYIV